MRVAFLGHDQPICGMVRPSGGFLKREDADRLVRELVVERISNKVIRALPPDSLLSMKTRNACRNYVPEKLPPKEVANVKFRPPAASNSDVPRTHFLPRYREVYGDLQLAMSL